MCGRYSLPYSIEKLRKKYGIIDDDIDFSPTGEIFPSNRAPVITKEKEAQQKPQLKLFRWGFSPSFASSLIINARGESVEKKATFKKAFYSRRCLIPAGSFFEWKDTNRGKVKYRISRKESNIFSLAGIFSVFSDEQGKKVPSFCIITTSAVEKIKPIHHRMPAILTSEEEKIWLNPEEKNTARLKKCLTPSRDELIIQEEN
ncbi:MAG: SOS response-associated peptidase [Halanaerobiaceae bacterium]